MIENKHTMDDLRMRQALPLSMKIAMSKTRIREWVNYYGEDGVYISFSGGKDSTVLVDLVDETFPGNNIPLVFVDTGLEYPEIREFVKGYGDRVVWLKPEMQFKKVIETYGYPFISKEVSETIWRARKYVDELSKKDESIEKLQNAYDFADLFGIERRSQESQQQYENLKKGICAEELLKNAPAHFKILFGKLEHKEKGIIIQNEYSKMYNRSKYAFCIDAPFNISNKCCSVMKKKPAKKYARVSGRNAITGQTAQESRLRTQKWLQHGCNAFDSGEPISNPISTWTEQDILLYIKSKNLPICSIYGDVVEDCEKFGQLEGQMSLLDFGDYDIETPPLKTTGCKRTGCMFCGYGCHLEKEGEGRFERMKETHPNQYKWIMKPWEDGGLGYKEVIDWLNENGNLNIRY